MIKKLLILLIFPMLFSCEALRELHPEPLFPRDDRDSRSGASSNAFGKDKVVKDILNRPINNEINFHGVTILIPEGTRLNDKKNRFQTNIVDIKTKIGLPIYFMKDSSTNSLERCLKIDFCKVINGKLYIMAIYGGESDDNDIFKKIAKVNGFVRGTY